MTRRVFTTASLATAASLNAQQATPPRPSVDDFTAHLEIWMFEARLNSYIPKKSIIEINPHTRRLIKEHAHHFILETRAALAKDITLLLVVKQNTSIAEHAQKKGLKVYRNSFGKEEWPEWLALLDEMADGNKKPTPK